MRSIRFVALVLMTVSCASVKPLPVRAGDVCFRCRQTIVQTRLAGEIIDSGSHALKFRTPACMAKYVKEKPDAFRGIFVTDYKTGAFVRATSANFVRFEMDPQTKTSDYAAFQRVNDAVAFGRENGSAPIDWLQLMRLTD